MSGIASFRSPYQSSFRNVLSISGKPCNIQSQRLKGRKQRMFYSSDDRDPELLGQSGSQYQYRSHLFIETSRFVFSQQLQYYIYLFYPHTQQSPQFNRTHSTSKFPLLYCSDSIVPLDSPAVYTLHLVLKPCQQPHFNSQKSCTRDRGTQRSNGFD